MTVAAQHLWSQPCNTPTLLLASALARLLPLPTTNPGLPSSHAPAAQSPSALLTLAQNPFPLLRFTGRRDPAPPPSPRPPQGTAGPPQKGPLLLTVSARETVPQLMLDAVSRLRVRPLCSAPSTPVLTAFLSFEAPVISCGDHKFYVTHLFTRFV